MFSVAFSQTLKMIIATVNVFPVSYVL